MANKKICTLKIPVCKEGDYVEQGSKTINLYEDHLEMISDVKFTGEGNNYRNGMDVSWENQYIHSTMKRGFVNFVDVYQDVENDSINLSVGGMGTFRLITDVINLKKMCKVREAMVKYMLGEEITPDYILELQGERIVDLPEIDVDIYSKFGK